MQTNWVIDLQKSTATHSNYGMVVRYTDNGDGSWDGRAVELGALPPDDFDESVLARMMREAGDEFSAALKKGENEKRN